MRGSEAPYGVVPAVETPFDEGEELDWPSIPAPVAYLAATGVQCLMHPGYASEFYKLDGREREAMLGLLLDEARHYVGLKVVAGVTDHFTAMAERSAVGAVEAGEGAINLLPPYPIGPPREEVVFHELSIESLGDLAELNENLRVLRVESVPPGPLVTALNEAQSPLEVIVADGGLFLPGALSRGATGVQPGCSFTEIYVATWAWWLAADTKSCTEIYSRLLPYLTYWMTSVELMVAVEKAISHRRGIIASPHCRRPSRRLDAEESAAVDRFLTEFEQQLRAIGGFGD